MKRSGQPLPWILRLPLFVALGFLLVSLPFGIDAAEPSIHAGFGGLLYVLLNFVPILLFGTMMDRFGSRDLETANLQFMTVCLAFWVVISAVVGLVVDNRGRGSRG